MQQRSELPEGWVSKELKDIITISSGKFIKATDYDKEPKKPYPVAGAGGPIGWTDKYNFNPPIVALGRVGAAGSLNVYHTNAWVTDNTLVVKPIQSEMLKWLILFFRTVDWLSLRTGSSQPLITQKIIKSLVIPLPPLAEQHRIVGAIEALFARLDATEARLARVPEIMKRFRQSVLAAACEGRLTEDWRELFFTGIIDRDDPGLLQSPYEEHHDYHQFDLPQKWIWTKISEIGEVSGGLTKNSTRNQFELKMPYLRVANVYSNKLDLSEIKTIGVREAEVDRYLLKQGDLLVVEGNGSKEQIGRVAQWDGSVDPCLHQNHIIRIRLNQDINRQFVTIWLLSSQGREMIT